MDEELNYLKNESLEDILKLRAIIKEQIIASEKDGIEAFYEREELKTIDSYLIIFRNIDIKNID